VRFLCQVAEQQLIESSGFIELLELLGLIELTELTEDRGPRTKDQGLRTEFEVGGKEHKYGRG